jgi:hypothetical protein
MIVYVRNQAKTLSILFEQNVILMNAKAAEAHLTLRCE